MNIIVALCFNALDLVTGFIAAVKSHDIQSSKLRDGLFKKVGFVICYILAWVLDRYGMQIGFSFAFSILPGVILYVVTTEIVSILENVCRMNPDIVPEKLKSLFHMEGGEHK